MANWVFTGLKVTGAPEAVQAFRDKASQPYSTHYKGAFIEVEGGKSHYDPECVREAIHESPLSFWNFLKPTDTEAYFGDAEAEDGWYNWNIENWGTKWDACDAEVLGEDKDFVSYNFRTAWDYAFGAFEAMTEQHPELEFDFEWEEEQGWGGEAYGRLGNLIVFREWGIPESHADYVALDRENQCLCASWDEEHWFEDCPREEL